MLDNLLRVFAWACLLWGFTAILLVLLASFSRLIDFDILYWIEIQWFKATIWLNPSKLSAQTIYNLDTNKRQLALEKVGFAKFLNEIDKKPLISDRFGSLYAFTINEERFTIVKVINASQEADGSFKEYYLRVQDGIQTPRQAVAWTFALEEHEYQPDIET